MIEPENEEKFIVAWVALVAVATLIAFAVLYVYDKGWKDGFYAREAIYEQVNGARK